MTRSVALLASCSVARCWLAWATASRCGDVLVVGAGLGLGVDRAGLGGLGRDLRRLRLGLGPLRCDDALLGDREGGVGALEVDEGARERGVGALELLTERGDLLVVALLLVRDGVGTRDEGRARARRSMRRRAPRPSAWPRDRSSHNAS